MQKSIVDILSKGSSRNEVKELGNQATGVSTDDRSSKLLKLLSRRTADNIPKNTVKIDSNTPVSRDETKRTKKRQTGKIATQKTSKKLLEQTRDHNKSCPLCGKIIDMQFYESHIQQELNELQDICNDDEDDLNDESWHNTTENTFPPPPPPPPQQQQQPPCSTHINKNTNPQQPKVVYVLGGIPEISVPKNPKQLSKILPHLSRSRYNTAATSFNHYDDCGGELDCDELGLEGAVGVAWEGVGATTY